MKVILKRFFTAVGIMTLNIFGTYHYYMGEQRMAFMYLTSFGLRFVGVITDVVFFLPLTWSISFRDTYRFCCNLAYTYVAVYHLVIYQLPLPLALITALSMYISGECTPKSGYSYVLTDVMFIWIVGMILAFAFSDVNTATFSINFFLFIHGYSEFRLLNLLPVVFIAYCTAQAMQAYLIYWVIRTADMAILFPFLSFLSAHFLAPHDYSAPITVRNLISIALTLATGYAFTNLQKWPLH